MLFPIYCAWLHRYPSLNSHSLSLTHTHTLTRTHSLTHTHTLTLTHSLSHTHTHTHTHGLRPAVASRQPQGTVSPRSSKVPGLAIRAPRAQMDRPPVKTHARAHTRARHTQLLCTNRPSVHRTLPSAGVRTGKQQILSNRILFHGSGPGPWENVCWTGSSPTQPWTQINKDARG